MTSDNDLKSRINKDQEGSDCDKLQSSSTEEMLILKSSVALTFSQFL